MIALLGGPTVYDSNEWIYSTWSIAHGNLACAYPPATTLHLLPNYQPGPYVAPLWPLVSGGIAALAGIGHTVPFPSQTALGPHCSGAYLAMYRWAEDSLAQVPTLGLAYASWVALLGGAVALLRSCGRGRTTGELFALLVISATPIVWMPLIFELHPQDFLAMGLGLGGLACVRRGSWWWAGALLGLAVTSQQFALLILAPLLVIVPGSARAKMLLSAICSAAVIDLSFIATTSGRAWGAILIGTGNFRSFGGTVLWELHTHGALLVALSRFAPIGVSMVLAWYVLRRLGPAVLDPVPLVSLIATCLSLRLVFEQNLFGYYFMALAVSLILLDVIRGRLRWELLVWIGLVTVEFPLLRGTLYFDAPSWGTQVDRAAPLAFAAILLALIVMDATRRRVRWYLVLPFVLVVVAFAQWPPWRTIPSRDLFPLWLWQILLVASGIWLATAPLIAAVRSLGTSGPAKAVTTGS